MVPKKDLNTEDTMLYANKDEEISQNSSHN